MQIRVSEDNDAVSRIIINGRNPSMRHMSRTQRIDVAWLNERLASGEFRFVTCPSKFQAADRMTKFFTDVIVWKRNLMLIGHFTSGKWMRDEGDPPAINDVAEEKLLDAAVGAHKISKAL